uniref:M6 family metalloprotease domain-containing protein n=1 Tax=Roseihalotalea indica TaxID=2867963 RepID=A0AA49JDA7_9BACT|nr:M6 family metalloprotease domain-containing protein [Tunicatimonas sp. TK19036]
MIPPAPEPFVEVQPDGSTITLYARGNAFNYWKETSDGYTVIKNSEGFYEYAMQMNKKLVPSGFKARSAQSSRARTSSVMPGGITKHLIPESNEKELLEFQNTRSDHPASPLSNSNQRTEATTLNFLVCLIEFPDYKHQFSKAELEQYFNSEGGAYPSVKEYYREVSNGELNINFTLSNWSVAENSIGYYGRQYGSGRARSLTREAINNAAAQGINFSQFDANGDKYIDGVIMLHAGLGAEEGANEYYIWSHKWSGLNMTIGGINFDSYVTVPETRNRHGRNGMVGIGVTCHEIGHLLGLPDLYDTRSGGYGIGSWGLMGVGGWAGNENFPTHMSAWSKEQMDWVNIRDITATSGEHKLLPVIEENVVYRINLSNPDEYFLLENRQPIGLDQSIPDGGLAIWHINKLKAKTLFEDPSNVVNTYGERGIDLEEADNTDIDSYYWAQSSNLFRWNDNFNLSTQPSSDYANTTSTYGAKTGVRVENIRMSGDTVVFDYERRMPNQGESCGAPLAAVVGENKTISDKTWYSFTMPADGFVYVSAAAGSPEFGVSIYRNCSGDATTSGYTDPQESMEVRSHSAKKGQKIIIEWESYDADSESSPLSWYLSLETGGVAKQDSLALVAYYNSMQGKTWPSYLRENWLTKPVSSWAGVTVKNNRVASVDLPTFSGTVPGQFFDLTALKSLSLFNGDYENGKAVLPAGIDKLKELRQIIIADNKSEINFLQQLSSLTALEILDITSGSISQALPDNLGNLKKLKTLSITSNNWSTRIPASLNSLTELQTLYLASEKLSGPLPGLSKLKKLYTLEIDGPVSGTLPESLGELELLSRLELRNTALTGSIPTSISRLISLESLTINHASLSGAIPSGVFDLPVLHSLDLSYNKLESLPENFLQSSSIGAYYLNNNQIKGTLPAKVTLSDNELELNLSYNRMSGILPVWVTETEWWTFDISHNQFEGKIPQITTVGMYNPVLVNNNRFTAMTTYNMNEDISVEFAVMCARNQLSFDDLVPNARILDNYSDDDWENFGTYEAFQPQDSVHKNITRTLKSGDSYRIDLGVDSTIQNVVYYWFKDDEPVDTTSVSYLEIENFSSTKAGSYRVESVYKGNPLFKNLILYYDGIVLQMNGKLDQHIVYTKPTTITYGDDPVVLNISAPAEGPVQLMVLEGKNRVILEETELTITAAGMVKIQASHPGDSQYNPTDTIITLAIEKANQTITFSTIEDKTYGSDDFLLEATASSNLPLSFTVEKGDIELDGKKVRIMGVGEVVIRASQNGSENFYPAESVTQTFSVTKQDQQITFTPIEDRTYGDTLIQLDVTSNRNLPVTIKPLTDNIELVEGQLRILQAGEAMVEATQPGDEYTAAAVPVKRTFFIRKREQIIRLDTIGNKMLADGAFTISAISNAGLAVNLTVVKGMDLVTVESSGDKFLITPLAVGQVVLQAAQPGDQNHEPANPRQEDFYIYEDAIDRQPQFITLHELPDTVAIGEEIILRAEISSGLPPAFRVEGPAQLVRDSVVQVTGTGTIIVRVSQSGNEEYLPAEEVARRITVARGMQQITFKDIPDTVALEQPLTLEALSNSSTPVQFRVLAGPANIQGNIASFYDEGEVTLEAYLERDSLYEAAQSTQTFYVKSTVDPLGRQAQELVYPEINDNELAYGDDSVDFPVTSDSNLPVTVKVEGANYEKGQLIITRPGTVTVTMYQEGNDEYLPSDTVTLAFVVDKGSQEIRFTTEEIESINDSTFTFNATSTSGLPVQYRVLEGEASLDGNQLIVHAGGEIRVEAYQEGDDFYKPTAGYFQILTVDLTEVVTSLQDELAEKLLMYPNPTADILHVRLPSGMGPVFYQLYNDQGSIVLKGTLKDNKLEVNTLPAGIYMIGLYLQDHWIYRKVLKKEK